MPDPPVSSLALRPGAPARSPCRLPQRGARQLRWLQSLPLDALLQARGHAFLAGKES